MSLNNNPIGIFDSGLGGLTVFKQVIRELPQENVIYFGDTARVPYGTKSKEAIIRFSIENVEELLKRKVKVIVIACNSSTSYALDVLQKEFDVPIIGVIEPGVRKAVEATRSGRIGIIATLATVNSGKYQEHIKARSRSSKIFSQACPLFVPLVEEGWLNTAVTRSVAAEYLKPLKAKKIDTLILGCTHYPLLKPVLRQVMGKDVELIDSAREVALEAKRVLQEGGLLRTSMGKAKYDFIISDRPQAFKKLAQKFLGFEID